MKILGHEFVNKIHYVKTYGKFHCYILTRIKTLNADEINSVFYFINITNTGIIGVIILYLQLCAIIYTKQVQLIYRKP